METKKRPQTRIDPEIKRPDPRFQYTPAVATDVQQTWMKYGWTPPSKEKQS